MKQHSDVGTSSLQMSLLLTGSIFALLAVALGAFGAHALRSILNHNALDVYETAVRYQMYHAIGLLVLGAVANVGFSHRTIFWAGIFLATGIMLFSGSLYLYLATNAKWLVFLTPVGGASFILGWLIFVLGIARKLKTRAFE